MPLADLGAVLLRRRADLPIVAEAACWLLLAWLALRLLPFRRVCPLFVRQAASKTAAPEIVGRVGWAVRTAAARVPWPAVCFPQGLAAQRMLGRRGVAADLVYGVAKDTHGRLEAHVWVETGGLDVVGGDGAARFAEVTRWSSAARADG